MTPGNPLVRPHLLEDYRRAARQERREIQPQCMQDTIVEKLIYVETDARYNTPTGANITEWASGPIDEIKFLRAIVESEAENEATALLGGIVLWAPMHQPTNVLEAWLRLAEETAGPKTWRRVKGFRFLLQSFTEPAQLREVLEARPWFVRNLRLLGRRNYIFDVTVDPSTAGVWQLESVAEVLRKAQEGISEEEKVAIVLDHICKPNFAKKGPELERWSQAVAAIAGLSNSYMKLSGAFSQLPEDCTSTSLVVDQMRPWMDQTFRSFGPSRIMFGSDWPVCNIRGQREDDSWVPWKEVVAAVLETPGYGLSESDKSQVWRETAAAAYRLDGNNTERSRKEMRL